MSHTETLPQILKNLATSSPYLLACILCMGVVVARWRSFGQGALLTLAGFRVLLLVSVGFTVLYGLLPTLLDGRASSERITIYSVISVVRAFAAALGLVLLLLGSLKGQSQITPTKP